MIRYILKGFFNYSCTSLCRCLIFTIMYFVPGDPAQITLSSNATAEEITQLQDQMGLNAPYFVQLGRFLYDLVHLDFGESYIYGTSVDRTNSKISNYFFICDCMYGYTGLC